MTGGSDIAVSVCYEIQDRFYGVLVGLAKRIMKKYEHGHRDHHH
jgi:hypothetical protein